MILLLPIEIICGIVEQSTLKTQASLSRSCRLLHKICNPILYENDVKNYNSTSVFHALVRSPNQSVALRTLTAARGAGACLTCCQDAKKHHPLSLFRLDTTLFSPLKLAARRGLDHVVSYFIDEGLPVDGADWTDSFRKTPLMEAIRCWQESTAILLVQNGASIGRQPFESEAFQAAIREDLPKLAVVIIERYGLDVNADIGYGCTPLVLAASYRRKSMVIALLEKGANVMPTMRRFGKDHAFVSILWILEAGLTTLRESMTFDNVMELIVLLANQQGATVQRNQRLLAIEAFLKLLDEARNGIWCMTVPKREDINCFLDALLQTALSVDRADTSLAILLTRWGASIQPVVLLQLLEVLELSTFDVDVLRCLRRHPTLLQCFDFVYTRCSSPSSQSNDLVEKFFLKHVPNSAVQLLETLKRYDLPLTVRGVEILHAEVLGAT
ncbi:uncharacterized protein FIESC28_05783 [Fusarium coffeatum]|uniref:Uncharacterized protein n=1 Tax=Fusarium coffeatum TaxID=231269 RepID=A0A366RPC1_9HYPO|nr:uncharacterized protein FIESC28_05783 [Fusarium coffeatum]RBR18961.1 hypothetical protein FIESC28_05783 [Fusarium coffeatum]